MGRPSVMHKGSAGNSLCFVLSLLGAVPLPFIDMKGLGFAGAKGTLSALLCRLGCTARFSNEFFSWKTGGEKQLIMDVCGIGNRKWKGMLYLRSVPRPKLDKQCMGGERMRTNGTFWNRNIFSNTVEMRIVSREYTGKHEQELGGMTWIRKRNKGQPVARVNKTSMFQKNDECIGMGVDEQGLYRKIVRRREQTFIF